MKSYDVYALATVVAVIVSPALAKGKGPSVSISQHSVVNAAVVAEVGNNSTASVTQSGSVNGAVVGQLGANATASVSQLGKINSSSIDQGP